MGATPKTDLHHAIKWATKLHLNQDRDGETPLPYITHPLDVLANLRYIGKVTDESLLVVAVLHDVIEETEATIRDVEERFGDRVAKLVGELTREEPDPKERSKFSEEEWYQLRNRLLLDGVRRMSHETKLVKLSDRLSNLREAMRTRTGKKLSRYSVQSRQLLEIIERDVNPELWDAVMEATVQTEAMVTSE